MVEERYHDVRQAYRIQKRLALNQCFRAIFEEWKSQKRLGYITFGGEDLYDAMDLDGVFSIRDHEIAVLSYEHDTERAEACRVCPVATTLSQVESITIEIVAAPFPVVVDKLETIRQGRQLIFFLDYTGTFRDKEAADLETLIDGGLIRIGDFVLITSCLTPRVVHNDSIMAKYDQSFRLLFKPARLDKEFRGRNHVDLLVALALSRCERFARAKGSEIASATLLRKFKYRDSRSPMGLWLYQISHKAIANKSLTDTNFDEFPHAFAKASEADIPNIFD